MRKLSSMLRTMRSNRTMDTVKVSRSAGTHGRADTSNIPSTHLGFSDLASKNG